MRARIAGMIVLLGIMALTTSFTPVQEAVVQDIVPHQLTAEEADCLVGGKATCVDVAVAAAGDCMDDAGVRPSEIGSSLYGTVVGGICAGYGVWTGLGCAWDWFTGLFG